MAYDFHHILPMDEQNKEAWTDITDWPEKVTSALNSMKQYKGEMQKQSGRRWWQWKES